MNCIQQWHQQGEIREFSTKEVCDIISAVMLINEQGVPNEVSIKDIILNACSNEHDENLIMKISQHISDIANSIAENREVDY